MTTNNPDGKSVLAIATFAAFATLGTALYMQQNKMKKKDEEANAALRREKRKYKARLSQTAEFQQRKQAYLERKKKEEARLRTVAVFNDDDEMVLKKIDVTKYDGSLPKGY